jgi:Uma2 family endonuclease
MKFHPQEQVGMSLEAFLAAGAEQPFELIEGEQLYRMPNYFTHSYLIRWMLDTIRAYLSGHNGGEAFQETTYVTGDSPDWVRGSRIPDIMVITAERYREFRQRMPRLQPGPLRLVPDLTIELVSPSEKPDETAKKIAADLANGVREVWVIDMTTQAAQVHTPHGVTEIAPDGALSTPLLPAFALSLPDLFAALDEV